MSLYPQLRLQLANAPYPGLYQHMIYSPPTTEQLSEKQRCTLEPLSHTPILTYYCLDKQQIGITRDPAPNEPGIGKFSKDCRPRTPSKISHSNLKNGLISKWDELMNSFACSGDYLLATGLYTKKMMTSRWSTCNKKNSTKTDKSRPIPPIRSGGIRRRNNFTGGSVSTKKTSAIWLNQLGGRKFCEKLPIISIKMRAIRI